jgi:hypothetical protein
MLMVHCSLFIVYCELANRAFAGIGKKVDRSRVEIGCSLEARIREATRSEVSSDLSVAVRFPPNTKRRATCLPRASGGSLLLAT